MTRQFNDWPLSRKLLTAFAAIGLTFLTLFISELSSKQRVAAESSATVSRSVKGTRVLATVLGLVRQRRIVVYAHVTAPLDKQAKFDAEIQGLEKDATQAIGQFRALVGDDFKTELSALDSAMVRLKETNDRVLAKSRQGDREGALGILVTDARDASKAAVQAAETLMDVTFREAEQRDVDTKALMNRSLLLLVGLTLFAFAVLGGIWALLSRTVAGPMAALAQTTHALAQGQTVQVPSTDRADELGKIAQAIEGFRSAAEESKAADARIAREQEEVTNSLASSLALLASGDLTAEIETSFPPAYAQLRTNFNNALQSLRSLVTAVIQGAASIRTGSAEIADASEDLEQFHIDR